jgi:uncharacterized membrane protein YhaH (DUF805 family)
MNWLKRFLFPRRLHRFAFLLRYQLLLVAAGVLGSVNSTSHSISEWIGSILFLTYYAFFVVLPRLRDLNMSGWWTIAAFVPIVGGVLGVILFLRAPMYLNTHGVIRCEAST